ncbi:MAG: hypothetical protein KGZ42_12185 [Melioribacter sp.]|nr:hypothetical protein [Melioribacter sp.]
MNEQVKKQFIFYLRAKLDLKSFCGMECQTEWSKIFLHGKAGKNEQNIFCPENLLVKLKSGQILFCETKPFFFIY